MLQNGVFQSFLRFAAIAVQFLFHATLTIMSRFSKSGLEGSPLMSANDPIKHVRCLIEFKKDRTSVDIGGQLL